jgi:acetyl-CoA carboxylase biotin carboxyl carrier protein
MVPGPGFAGPGYSAGSVLPPPGSVAPPAAPSDLRPAEDTSTVAIKSPTVGTFYEASSPGDSPFVSIGSKVTQDTVVCIIEAMKVFNQITADVNGIVTEVLVKNGDAVEFGQPLFRVRLG